MNQYQLLFVRILLGAAFAILISKMFYPRANIVYVAGLGIILIVLSYLAGYLRRRRG